MRIRREEAHRALELLEDYHRRLQQQQQNSSPLSSTTTTTIQQQEELRQAIERIIKIFRSKLFQALLDIQEFYEVTLQDDHKAIETKTRETLRDWQYKEQQQQQQQKQQQQKRSNTLSSSASTSAYDTSSLTTTDLTSNSYTLSTNHIHHPTRINNIISTNGGYNNNNNNRHHQQYSNSKTNNNHNNDNVDDNYVNNHNNNNDDDDDDDVNNQPILASDVQDLLSGRLNEILGAVLKHQQQKEQDQQQLNRRKEQHHHQTLSSLNPLERIDNLTSSTARPVIVSTTNTNQSIKNHSQLLDNNNRINSNIEPYQQQSRVINNTQHSIITNGINTNNREIVQVEQVHLEDNDDDDEDNEEEQEQQNTIVYNGLNNNNEQRYHHNIENSIMTTGAEGAWEFEEIILERGNQGLGFSIAGGIDNPHIADDCSIYITKLIPGGSAAADGRLQIEDIILKVNETSLIDVAHKIAVNALQHAGNRVHLLVKRRRNHMPKATTTTALHQSQSQFQQLQQQQQQQSMIPPSASAPANIQNQSIMASSSLSSLTMSDLVRIELFKATSKGLGFSIAGGVGNEHLPGDNNIYVTKIMDKGAAALDGRLECGDRLVAVNDILLENVTHEDAVAVLKSTSDHVILTVRKPQQQSSTYSMNQMGNNNNSITVAVTATTTTTTTAKTTNGSTRPPPTSLSSTNFSSNVNNNNNHTFNNQRMIMPTRNSIHSLSSSSAVAAAATTTTTNTGQINPVQSFRSEDNLYNNNNNNQRRTRTASGSTNLTNTNAAATILAEDSDELDRTDIDREPRRLILSKGQSTGLGFNIVGGEDGQGIFVSFILAGGPADSSGQLYRGDQILAVNGMDLRRATHEEAAAALKGAGQTVNLLVAYRPEEYRRFEARIQDLREQHLQATSSLPLSGVSTGTLRTSQKRTLYVRALFDYEPIRDSGLPSRGLPFRFGDILHVTNASDDEWWQARRVLLDGTDDILLGIIPSKRRVERRERARLKSVKFHGSDHYSDGRSSSSTLDRKKKNFSFSRKFPFMKSRESSTEDISGSYDHLSEQGGDEHLSMTRHSYNHHDRSSISGSNSALEDIREDRQQQQQQSDNNNHILSYEAVIQTEIDYMRPVIILGPLKERINDDLISEYPDRFGSCVPHTTRPPKEGEIHGRDYYFVTTREEMERDIESHLFIEAGQYRDNLYGTKISAVRELSYDQQKHCILDVSAAAIRRLQAANLMPITILIRPRSIELLKEWDKRITDDECRRQYERSIRTEQEYGQYFLAIISCDTPEEIYAKVKLVIHDNSGPYIWISAKNQKI
ncbi:disks large homolog 4 [Dermatophagoides farinae]|uniref:disks large homolog 4 n=1 Tax=Dermatophagoides farinae TaxID=6954 RepID=UPI003F6172F1